MSNSYRSVSSTQIETPVEAWSVSGETYPRLERLINGQEKRGPGTIPTAKVSPVRIMLQNAATTHTNLAAADAFYGSNLNIWPIDLSWVTQVRLTGRITTAGDGGKIQARIRDGAFSTTVSEYLIMGATSVEILTTTAGIADSGWINLVTGFKKDGLFLALCTIDGDGAIDPVSGNIELHLR